MHVVITGGNKGIGLSLIKKYLSTGANVTSLCRQSSADLDATQAKVITGIDVTNSESLENAVKDLDPIDLLISNAGLLIGDTFDHFDLENINQQFQVNTLGPLRLAKACAQKLKRGAKYGIITSRMGSIADNTSGGQYGYRLSKAAANAVGKSLSEDFRSQEITVLMLHPGYVKTDMTGGRGLIDTAESAEGLYKILEEKTLEKTGSFWHAFGDELPW
ncbi:MAG: SDR family oxidoreductase [Bacteriovoracaceae bacterium]|nr:SDR family oxidoreductase [Bacteriovoracaceae bacterium]